MKKKLWLGIAVMSILFGLTGCGSKLPKAEDAVTAMINSEIYDKDDDKYEEYFHLTLDTTEDPFKEVREEFTEMGMPTETADKVVEKLVEQIRKNTSFDIVASDVKDKITTVTVNVYGIDATQFDKNIEEITTTEMLKELKELGFDLENLDDLDKLAETLSEEDFEKFANYLENFDENELLNQVIFKAIDNLEKSKTPSEYKVMLKVNDDNKNAWEIINHDIAIDQLATLLFKSE